MQGVREHGCARSGRRRLPPGPPQLPTDVGRPRPRRSDVPLAWKLLWEGFGWPLRAFAEYKNGSLMEDDAKIVS